MYYFQPISTGRQQEASCQGREDRALLEHICTFMQNLGGPLQSEGIDTVYFTGKTEMEEKSLVGRFLLHVPDLPDRSRSHPNTPGNGHYSHRENTLLTTCERIQHRISETDISMHFHYWKETFWSAFSEESNNKRRLLTKFFFKQNKNVCYLYSHSATEVATQSPLLCTFFSFFSDSAQEEHSTGFQQCKEGRGDLR